MKVRADIAALIREGHTDESIAHRLGCHRDTVRCARRALRLPPADQLGRLYAEAVPTGRVLSDKPTRVQTSPAQAAANRRALLAALAEAA
jgi:predicted aminopeptidase